MISDETIESQAKEALGTLSLAEQTEQWEGQKYIQTVVAVNRICQTARTKERKYRISSRRVSHQQSKA